MNDGEPIERVEEAAVRERGPLRDGVRGLRYCIRVPQIGLLHGARQNKTTTLDLSGGQHDVHCRDEVRVQHGEDEVEVARTSHLTGEMEDDIRPDATQECLNGHLVGQIGPLPAHRIRCTQGLPRDRVHDGTLLQGAPAKPCADEAGAPCHQQALSGERAHRVGEHSRQRCCRIDRRQPSEIYRSVPGLAAARPLSRPH